MLFVCQPGDSCGSEAAGLFHTAFPSLAPPGPGFALSLSQLQTQRFPKAQPGVAVSLHEGLCAAEVQIHTALTPS